MSHIICLIQFVFVPEEGNFADDRDGCLCSIDHIVLVLIQLRWIIISDFRGINLDKWRELRQEKGEVANLEIFFQHVHGNHFIPNTVLVDCTADSVIASNYEDWLLKGIHVITPNKKANSGPLYEVKWNKTIHLLWNRQLFCFVM